MKKFLSLILTLFIFSMPLGGCTDKEEPKLDSYDFIAMDTVFSIQTGTLTADSGNSKDDILAGCESVTDKIESAISRTVEGSDVHGFNKKINVLFDVDPIFIEVLTVALDISGITDGAYDPTIGSLTSLWNVKGGGPVPEKSAIDSARAVCGTDLIEIKDDGVYKSNADLMLDLGGIGKGYAAQKLVEHLYSEGFSYGIVSAGRTVGVFGAKSDGSKFKIGIADPFNSDGVVGYLYTDGGFVSVAGDYEQFFEEDGVRYHHIIDPSTGYPSDSGLSSVAVFSQNGTAADALSTALMVMGFERGIEFYKSSEISFEAIFICNDGTVRKTDGLTEDRFELCDTYDPKISTVADSTAVNTASNTTVDTTVSASDE